MESRHEWVLSDTCYGMTGGDLYVCQRCTSRAVTCRMLPPPNAGPNAKPCARPGQTAEGGE